MGRHAGRVSVGGIEKNVLTLCKSSGDSMMRKIFRNDLLHEQIKNVFIKSALCLCSVTEII